MITLKLKTSERSRTTTHIQGILNKAVFAALFFLVACNDSQFYQISGTTMGTTYHITYEGSLPETTKKEIDGLLADLNQSLSTYIPNSTISKINNNQAVEIDDYFTEVFEKAKEIHRLTNGAFDPTVGPVVNAWGFGYKEVPKVDSALIDSLMDFVGFDMVLLENGKISKEFPEIIIDFSAIAKGYGVDKVAEHLEIMGIKNYMVEIGGEVVVKGNSQAKQPWTLGVNMPVEGSNDLFAVARMTNGALATSGNYRNFKIVEGKKYVHTIDPRTGYGAISSQLSASVFANDCTTADGLATALMVFGKEESIDLSKKLGLHVYLIYLNDKNQLDFYRSDELQDVIKTAL